MDAAVELEIIVPAGPDEDEPLDAMLIEITKAIAARDPEIVAHGFLGGEFGYGASYENDVFEMRPFYWGDCDCGYEEREAAFSDADPGHAEDCYQSELKRRERAAGWTETEWGFLSAPDDWPWEKARATEDAIYKALCAEYGLPYPSGCAVHCTCGCDGRWKAWAKENGHTSTCSLELPNFRHKASGFEVRWYKYIGRGQETTNAPGDLSRVLAECLDSVRAA